MKKIIALDIGTQSLRAVVFDVTGNEYFQTSRSYTPDFSPGNKAEQDPETWEWALNETLSEVGSYLTEKEEILCIAITCQRASIIPLDENDKPLHPAYMWQDKRATEECHYIASKIDPEILYRESGLRLDPYFSLPKILYYRNRHAERWCKTRKILGVQDYVNFLLTGTYRTDYSQACRTMLLDLKQRKWNKKILRLLDIDESLLCELCEPGSKSGELTRNFANKTGLKEGIPVLLCGGDQQCSALSLGLMKQGRVTANTGTGSFVLGYAQAPIFDKEQRILCSCGALPRSYVVEAGIYASGAMYNWCRKELFDSIEKKEQSFKEVNHAVDSVPPGAGGILVLPHFQGSAAPYWNPLAKGVIYNLGLGTSKAEISRAMIEAIALEISDNITLIEENSENIDTVYVAGGLTKFATYCQVLADCLNKTVVRRDKSEATLMGCLMIACVNMGIYKTFDEAYNIILDNHNESFKPIAKNIKVYEKKRSAKRILYNALYSGAVYEATQDLLE